MGQYSRICELRGRAKGGNGCTRLTDIPLYCELRYTFRGSTPGRRAGFCTSASYDIDELQDSTTNNLNATASGTSYVRASLAQTSKNYLVGAAAATSTLTGNMSKSGVNMLMASAAGSSAASATMTRRARLVGSTVGTSVVSATMTRRARLSGTTLATSMASATATVSARLIGSTPGTSQASATATVAAGGYDTDAQNYFTAMTVQPDNTRKNLINNLIVGAKSDGWWTKLDWFVLLAAHDAQAGRVNARTPSKLMVATNSPTFTTDRGYSGDGTSSYLSFNELFNAAGNQFSLNSASLGAWCNLQGNTASVRHMGMTGNNQNNVIAQSAGSETYNVNDGTSNSARTSTTKLGHRTTVRVDANSKKAAYNGAITNNTAVASTSIPTSTPTVLRGQTVYAADRIAAAYFGAALTDADITNLHNRLSTYLTAIGAN